MPPVRNHLKYQEVTDFATGLFSDPGSGTQLLMPANAAQQLDNAYPQPAGGLRAFFTSTSLTTSGVVAPTQEECTGIFAVTGYAKRSGAGGQGANGGGTVYYMTTWNSVTNIARIYRMDTTGGQTAWVAEFTSSATSDTASSRYQSSFSHFVDSSGVDWTLVVLRSSFDRGLYKVRYDAAQANSEGGTDGDATLVVAHDGALCVSQARAIVGSHETGDDQTIWWSAVGTLTFTGTTSGHQDVAASYPRNAVTLLSPVDPDQILVGLTGAPWVTITGDINSSATPVRAMGDGHYPSLQDAVRTPEGIVFMTSHGPAYQTDGRQFENITPYLPGFNSAGANAHFSGLGTGAYGEGFLFLPTGLVRFEESKGWFKVTDQVGQYIFADPSLGIISASNDVSFTIRVRAVNRSLGTRVSSWTWRSAPFAQPDGTQSEVREVQIDAQVYSASTFTVVVTDHLGNQTTATAAAVAAGRQVTAIPILARGEYCDVKLTCAADNGSSEAPTVEKVRIGFGMGHSL